MYIIEKCYRNTGKVIKFKAITMEEAKKIFIHLFYENEKDMYNRSIDTCIKTGHASFEDFYIFLSRADFLS